MQARMAPPAATLENGTLVNWPSAPIWKIGITFPRVTLDQLCSICRRYTRIDRSAPPWPLSIPLPVSGCHAGKRSFSASVSRRQATLLAPLPCVTKLKGEASLYHISSYKYNNRQYSSTKDI
jgi:hypothetical protein